MRLAPDQDFLDALATCAFEAAKRHVGDRHAVLGREHPHALLDDVERGAVAELVHLQLSSGDHVTVRVAYTGECTVTRRLDEEEIEDTLVLEQRGAYAAEVRP